MTTTTSFYNMFSNLHASSAEDFSNDSDTAAMICGANGTYSFETTGEELLDKLLDVFSSSTRIDGSKPDATELERFKTKLDACLKFGDNTPNDVVTDAVKYFAAHTFYLRDVKEKGERTLFQASFICIWDYDSELAKLLMKFIVGTDGADYFGSWKDLKQIPVLAKNPVFGLTAEKYDELYRYFQGFECAQLLADWTEYVECKRLTGSKAGTRPDLSLVAKWTVGAGKHFDEALEHNSKSYVANYCETNFVLIKQMSMIAHDAKIGGANSANSGWKRTLKPTDFIAQQRVLRKVKSALNTELDTPEQKMCAGKWRDITITHVPARNMTKHRSAFNNEKAKRDRKAGSNAGRCTARYIAGSHANGDRFEIPDEFREIRYGLLEELKSKIADPEFPTLVAAFLANKSIVAASAKSEEFRKAIDRIICRFNVVATMVKPVDKDTKTIHGARSDLNDLVVAAWNISGGATRLDPNKIGEWAARFPERALIHTQVQDKIREIEEAIRDSLAKQEAIRVELAAAAAATALEAGIAPVPVSVKEIRINFKKAICLADTSDSMLSGTGSVRPLDISVGLAYFLAQLTCDRKSGRLPVGITFETTPHMYQIPMDMDFVSALHYIKGQKWGGSTNVVGAFRLILNWGIENNLTPEQMVECMIIPSDMQFDAAQGRTSDFETMYETLKREFNAAGYELPLIVFWNLNGSYAGQTVNANTPGVITLSGFDPALFKTMAECESLGTEDVKSGTVTMASPKEVMIKALSRERYLPILELVSNYYDQDEDIDAEQPDQPDQPDQSDQVDQSDDKSEDSYSDMPELVDDNFDDSDSDMPDLTRSQSIVQHSRA